MNTLKKIPVAKIIATAIMFGCLFLLTAANFIIYPQQHSGCTSCSKHQDANEEESSVPAEEKSSAKNNFSIQEEYLQDFHTLRSLHAALILSEHKMIGGEKLTVVHFAPDAPPPKC